jgi:hypothetical protein
VPSAENLDGALSAVPLRAALEIVARMPASILESASEVRSAAGFLPVSFSWNDSFPSSEKKPRASRPPRSAALTARAQTVQC